MTTKISTTNIQDTALTTLLGPKVTTIVYPGTETATDTNGGETINLTGNGFQSGCSVLVSGTAASVVTFISSTQISFVAPAQTAGTYVIYVINPDGGTAISIPGISYSGTPNWTTAAGSLGTAYEAGSISATLTATGDAPITYVLATGTLPTGSSLSSGGSLSGTAPATASATTYNFTITAKDAQNQTTNRSFSLTINPDVVTWSSPANLTTYNVYTNAAIANVTMSATSAAGGSITYTADTLPSGLSITGANIAGTPTVAASTTTVLTATATSTRTATRTINWVVSVANDTYFKNTTLLLNGETTVTPFISDASTNSFGLTIVGDTKPTLFSPYQGGYYSNLFNGSTDYITAPANAAWSFGSGDFTVECWVYATSTPVTSSQYGIVANQASGDNATWTLQTYNGNFRWCQWSGGYIITGSSTILPNRWYHVAVARTGGVNSLYVNGVLDGSVTGVQTYTTNAVLNIGFGTGSGYWPGYISNVRIVKGTALYTTTFTPSTTPLSAITNTSILTCQSNRFIDNSTNAFTVTVTGTPQISPAIPFTQNSSYSTYGSTYFDGTGDYLTAPANAAWNFTGDWTFECWIYPTAITGYHTFLGQWGAPDNVFIWKMNSSGRMYLENLGVAITATTTTIVTNQWQHIALTRSSNTIRMFVNGVLDSTTATRSGTYYSSGAMRIGASGVNENFIGYIGDMRILNGTATYTTAFTPTTSLLTAVANTSLLTLQYNGGANNSGIIDNSNFNNIITRAGNTSQGTFSPYSQTGFSTYFNGSAGYINSASSTNNALGAGDYTIEFWCYSNSLGGSSAGSPFYVDASGYQQLIRHNGSAWECYYKSGTSFTNVTIPTGSITLNAWTHHALVRNSGTVKWYINGVQQGSASDSTNFTASTYFQLGNYASLIYDGYVSNVRVVKGTAVYTSAFTPPTSPLTPITGTIFLTAQSNRFIDNGPLNTALTITSTPSVQAYSPFGSIREATPLSYSNYFNGSTDYLSTPVSSNYYLTGDFTVEWWFYCTSATVTEQMILGSANSSSPDYFAVGGSPTSVNMGINTGGSFYPYWNYSFVPNTWYHVAVVRKTGTLSCYVNGIAQTLSGGSASNSQTIFNSGSGLQIGRYGATAAPDYFNGNISNLRVVNGTCLYTTNFTPSTTPLTAVANTVLLTCQSATIVDNSANALTITANGSPKVYKYNPFGYTAQTNASYTPSIHGGSCYFDGNSDYLNLANNTAWSSLSGDFTIECWFYFMNSTQQQQVLFTQRSSSNQYVPYLFWTSNATIVMYSSSNNSSWDIINGTAVVSSWTPQTWNHFAFTRSGSTNRIFFNGVQTYTYTNSSSFTNSGTFNLGMSPGETNTATYGYVTDARLTKTAIYTSNFVPPTQTLTNYSTTYPASLLLNFNNGGIIDQHSSNVLETVGNAQLSTSIKKYNNASIYFDGSGDYLKSPSNPAYGIGTGDYTLEFWVYSNIAWSGVICLYNNNSGGYFLQYNTGTGLQTGVTGSSATGTYAVTLTSGTWNHIAVSRASGSSKCFVNGTQVGSTVSDTTNYAQNGAFIGALYNGDQALNGYIDDLRLTKGYARYTSNFTAPTSALITK